MTPAPPAVARTLIRLLTPADLREPVLDDLQEAFERLTATDGPGSARRWYWRQAFHAARVMPILRSHRRRDDARAGGASGSLDGPRIAGPDALWRAFRHAWRRLAGAPGFVVSAGSTLALAFAANLTVFALVYGVLLAPMPYANPDRLVDVGHRMPGAGVARAGQSQGGWVHYRDHAKSFDAFGIYNENLVNLTDADRAEQVPIAMVSHEVFHALGVTPLLGAFGSEDDGPGAPPDVLLSHRLWQRRYGGDATIVGRSIEVNGNPRRVLGVMPADFAFPSPSTELWMRQGYDRRERRFGELASGSVARLRPGVTAAQAEAELTVLAQRLPDVYSDVRPSWLAETGLAPRVEPLRDAVVGDVRAALWITLLAGGAVLLLAAANVTNLFLIRSEQRRRDVGIALAIGATRTDVLLSQFAEAMLLTSAAALPALALSRAAVSWAGTHAASMMPRLESVALGGPAFAVLAAMTAGIGMLLTMASHWRTRHVTLVAAGRGTSASPDRTRLRLALCGVQVALAFLLVSTTAFLGLSVWNLVRLDPGFRATGVMTFEISLPHRRYETLTKAATFHRELVEALEAQPGIEAAGAVFDLPLSGFTMKRYLDSQVFVERDGQSPASATGVAWKLATPGYFGTMAIPIRAGRWFEPGDHFDAAVRPLVVSERFARRHLGGDPIGRRIRHFAAREWATVVGVVGDVRDTALRDADALAVYVPVLDQAQPDPFVASNMSYAVRHDGDQARTATLIQSLVRARDPKIAVARLQPMAAIVRGAMARETLVLALVLSAAAMAVLVGLVGLYGALGFTIAQRRRELGVRIALGASTVRLRWDVARPPLAAVAAGLIAGGLAAGMTVRLVSRLLFEVEATEAAVFVLSAAALGLCACVAIGAALRALGRISPVEALQAE